MDKDNAKKNDIESYVQEDIFEELIKIAEVDPVLKKALNAWEEISLSEEHREAYKKRLKELDSNGD